MSRRDQERLVSRRQFVKSAAAGAALGAAALYGGALLTGCSGKGADDGKAEARQSQAQQPELSWAKEADVVVLGTGTIFTAALAAHDAGAKVLMLEKAPTFGGTTATSGGGMWIPNNFLMKQDGVADSREKAVAYMKRAAEGQSEDRLIETYVDKAPEMLEYLRDKCGFVFERDQTPTPRFAEYYPYDGFVISRSVYTTPRGGKALMEFAKKAVDQRGIEVLFNTPAKRLITNGQGEVIGVVAEMNGREVNIKARRGVVIGTGGFEWNQELVRHYLRAPIFWSVTAPTCTGDGLLMGMAVGADLRNMNECWGLPGYKPNPDAWTGEADWQMFRGKPGCIVVNRHGERFGNESTNYDAFIKAFQTYDTGTFEWRNIPGFAIFDSGYAKRYPLPGSGYQVGVVPDWITVADTLEELAEKLGINPEGLRATVDRFNENARNGVDPDWHRGETTFDQFTAGDLTRTDLKNPCLAPLEEGPFYGAAIWPGTCGTNGGLRINENAQVLSVWGKPIPRLYCSSNTAANVFGVAYPGGGSCLGSGMTFGYIAGRHVASLQPWG